MKRQTGLQDYLGEAIQSLQHFQSFMFANALSIASESLLQVPGILEDPALLHFLELEKHLELHGDLSLTGAGSNGRSSGMWGTKSAVLTENDRLSAIVESAAQAFIDISEVPEPLEAEQATQRKNEILSAANGLLSEQKISELFDSTVTTLWLPKAPFVASTQSVIERLEHETEDDALSFEETRDFVWSVLENVEASLRLDASTLSSVELVSVMKSSALPPSSSASTPALSSSLDAMPEEYGSNNNSYNGASPSF